ncbi:MAG: hypothetical protein AAFQ86_15125, partial [Bacteroidota bacterium]
MNTFARSLVVFAALVGIAFSMMTVLAFRSYGEQEHCAADAPVLGEEGSGYEVLNLAGRDVWATRDWTPEAFEAFSFPATWLLWRKNDPRVGLADRAEFLQSPGCERGTYSHMAAFDRRFVQVVELIDLREPADDDGLVRRVSLEKYHVLHFDAGRTVRVLASPTGERFIEVSWTLLRKAYTPTLPTGWTLTSHRLSEPLRIELLGRVSALRMDNQDSFQGPLTGAVPLGLDTAGLDTAGLDTAGLDTAGLDTAG